MRLKIKEDDSKVFEGKRMTDLRNFIKQERKKKRILRKLHRFSLIVPVKRFLLVMLSL